jgi:hypothetical protein
MSWTEKGVTAIALHAEKKKRKLAQNTQFNTNKHTSLMNTRKKILIVS